MENNIVESGIWGGLLLPFFTGIDWGWLFGATIAVVAAVMRYMEWKETKRANDLKEQELKKGQ